MYVSGLRADIDHFVKAAEYYSNAVHSSFRMQQRGQMSCKVDDADKSRYHC